MGFLNQIFKHRETGESAPVGSDAAVKSEQNPFLHPKEPPARLQSPLIHTPSSLGAAARAMSASSLEPQLPTMMFLEFGDILPRVPEQYVQRGTHNLRQLLRFDAAELAQGMAKGRVEVALPKIAEQTAQVFFVTAREASEVMVRLPLQKLVDQMGDSSVLAARFFEEKAERFARETLQPVEEINAELPAQLAEPSTELAGPPALEVPSLIQEEAPILQDATPIAFQTAAPPAPTPYPSDDDLIVGPLLNPVHASVDAPLQASLSPITLSATIPQPELSPAHAPASETPFVPPPIRLQTIQAPQVRAVVLEPTATTTPEVRVEAPPTPPPDTPAPPEPESSSEPYTLALQKIFLTDEALDLPAIARHIAALPGVLACHISCADKSAQGGTFPEAFDAALLQSHAPGLTASVGDAAAHLRIGDVQNVTLHVEDRAVTIFSRGSVVLGAVLGQRDFVPGVRERLTKVVEVISFS